jgi:hypothetical protein
MPYEEIDHQSIALPQRERHDDYTRMPVPASMIVPEVF